MEKQQNENVVATENSKNTVEDLKEDASKQSPSGGAVVESSKSSAPLDQGVIKMEPKKTLDTMPRRAGTQHTEYLQKGQSPKEALIEASKKTPDGTEVIVQYPYPSDSKAILARSITKDGKPTKIFIGNSSIFDRAAKLGVEVLDPQQIITSDESAALQARQSEVLDALSQVNAATEEDSSGTGIVGKIASAIGDVLPEPLDVIPKAVAKIDDIIMGGVKAGTDNLTAAMKLYNLTKKVGNPFPHQIALEILSECAKNYGARKFSDVATYHAQEEQITEPSQSIKFSHVTTVPYAGPAYRDQVVGVPFKPMSWAPEEVVVRTDAMTYFEYPWFKSDKPIITNTVLGASMDVDYEKIALKPRSTIAKILTALNLGDYSAEASFMKMNIPMADNRFMAYIATRTGPYIESGVCAPWTIPAKLLAYSAQTKYNETAMVPRVVFNSEMYDWTETPSVVRGPWWLETGLELDPVANPPNVPTIRMSMNDLCTILTQNPGVLAPFGQSTWSRTTAVVPVHQDMTTNPATLAWWILAHTAYPFARVYKDGTQRSYASGGITHDEDDRHIYNIASHARISGPYSRVLLVEVDGIATFDLNVNGIVVNSDNPAAPVDIGLHLAQAVRDIDIADQYISDALKYWMRIAKHRPSLRTALNWVAEHCFRLSDGTTQCTSYEAERKEAPGGLVAKQPEVKYKAHTYRVDIKKSKRDDISDLYELEDGHYNSAICESENDLPSIIRENALTITEVSVPVGAVKPPDVNWHKIDIKDDESVKQAIKRNAKGLADGTKMFLQNKRGQPHTVILVKDGKPLSKKDGRDFVRRSKGKELLDSESEDDSVSSSYEEAYDWTQPVKRSEPIPRAIDNIWSINSYWNLDGGAMDDYHFFVQGAAQPYHWGLFTTPMGYTCYTKDEVVTQGKITSHGTVMDPWVWILIADDLVTIGGGSIEKEEMSALVRQGSNRVYAAADEMAEAMAVYTDLFATFTGSNAKLIYGGKSYGAGVQNLDATKKFFKIQDNVVLRSIGPRYWQHIPDARSSAYYDNYHADTPPWHLAVCFRRMEHNNYLSAFEKCHVLPFPNDNVMTLGMLPYSVGSDRVVTYNTISNTDIAARCAVDATLLVGDVSLVGAQMLVDKNSNVNYSKRFAFVNSPIAHWFYGLTGVVPSRTRRPQAWWEGGPFLMKQVWPTVIYDFQQMVFLKIRDSGLRNMLVAKTTMPDLGMQLRTMIQHSSLADEYDRRDSSEMWSIFDHALETLAKVDIVDDDITTPQDF